MAGDTTLAKKFGKVNGPCFPFPWVLGSEMRDLALLKYNAASAAPKKVSSVFPDDQHSGTEKMEPAKSKYDQLDYSICRWLVT